VKYDQLKYGLVTVPSVSTIPQNRTSIAWPYYYDISSTKLIRAGLFDIFSRPSRNDTYHRSFRHHIRLALRSAIITKVLQTLQVHVLQRAHLSIVNDENPTSIPAHPPHAIQETHIHGNNNLVPPLRISIDIPKYPRAAFPAKLKYHPAGAIVVFLQVVVSLCEHNAAGGTVYEE